MIEGLAGKGKGALREALGLADAKDITQETQDNLDKVQKMVEDWQKSAGESLTKALGVPVDAISIKYHALLEKLEQELKTLAITPAHAEEARQGLAAAQKMEADAKVFEAQKQHTTELAKLDEERIKGSYEAQIAYIEALDEQDMRKKVAAIDHITALRVESAQKVAEVQDDELQRIFDSQKAIMEAHRAELQKQGVDVDRGHHRCPATDGGQAGGDRPEGFRRSPEISARRLEESERRHHRGPEAGF